VQPKRRRTFRQCVRAWPESAVGCVIKPRLRELPAALGTRGGELIALAKKLGYRLDDWQCLVANDILATNGEGLAAFECVVLVSRQCGKSLIAELYALLFALQDEAVLFTSHRADSSKEIFRRLLASLPEEMGAIETRTNGKEQIAFPGGGVIAFRTRNARVGRGFSFDRVIVDECQIVDVESIDAILPTLRTRPDPQIVYLGCAPNARLSEHCQVLNELRERAKRGNSESLYLVEWGASVLDDEGVELQADELSEAMLDDERLWAQATPALESGRLTLERMRVEREAMDPVSFAVEYLTVGIWPDAAGGGGGPVSLEAWRDLVDVDSEIDPSKEQVPELVVGFDMNNQRRVSVCVVGRRADGLLHLDYVGAYEGTSAAVAAIAKIFERPDVDVRWITADGTPANLDLFDRLEREYVPAAYLRREGAAHVGVQGCGGLVDLTAERKLRHRGQVEIENALRGAVVKVIGDSWVYSRSRSRSDVSPLLAAAAALWAAETELTPGGVAEIAIY
jgi:hypothetical protein